MSRLRYLSLVALTLLASASFSATKPTPAPAAAIPKVVRAQAFELTDAAGKTRAWLGVSDDGATVLKLLDGEGKTKVLVDSDGLIEVLDAEGKARVTVGAMGDGYGIGLLDSKGTIRADLCLDSSNAPSVTVRDAAGNMRGTLAISDDEPLLILKDAKDEGARLALDMEDSLPVLSLWDTAGKPRASYSLTKGGALLQMTDADGMSLAEMAAGSDRPSLILQDQESKMAAFLGFTADTDLSLLLQNGQSKTQIGLLLYGTDPTLAIAHPNGNPAASMRIGGDGAPYVRTSDKDNVTIWKSP